MEDKMRLSHGKFSKTGDVLGRWSIPLYPESPQQPSGQGFKLHFGESSSNAHSVAESWRESGTKSV